MNNIVYDITLDKGLQKILKDRKKYFDDDNYISKYGDYGTVEWWKNLNRDGLIVGIICKVLKIYGTGDKMNFPVFQVEIGGSIHEFECKGNQDDYAEGIFLRLFLVDRKKVLQGDGDGYQLLKVERVSP